MRPWNDGKILDRFQTGHKYAQKVTERFWHYGIPAETTPPAVAGSQAEAANFHDEFDVTAAGRRIEVKSRDLAFTGPRDFPYPTAFVYRVNGWRNKTHRPTAIVLASQKREGGFAVIRVSDEPLWTIRKVRDREMNVLYEAFEIESKRLVQFEELVLFLRGGIPDR